MIEIKNVHKNFEDNYVLKGVDLKIETGEAIAVIGKSGCGKSVLLKLIVGLLFPVKGEIYVDGNNVLGLKDKELYNLRRRFGYLFQGAALFDSLTVEENISLPIVENNSNYSVSELKKNVAEKLELVGLPGIEKLKPSELSGGMKKRVGLARALINNPDYILYDEPTTGLDPISADVIDDLIMNLKQALSVTAIVVTHDMYTVKNAVDRIAMLNDGKIYFDGTADEMIKSKDKVIREFIKRTT
ncbi:MAG: ABC transporter ATP-binding protein [Melioribacteraceae bacterium]|nr:ABC transporter ATP-binding protein [Melioribacteraceae bacterium]MCO6472228.1 ABC transporter ATP-binding protein [Melioribacteraceae bacterium]MDD3559117.1 ABC transporter ATP-binding protein [Melioribacteraceae bacterium]